MSNTAARGGSRAAVLHMVLAPLSDHIAVAQQKLQKGEKGSSHRRGRDRHPWPCNSFVKNAGVGPAKHTPGPVLVGGYGGRCGSSGLTPSRSTCHFHSAARPALRGLVRGRGQGATSLETLGCFDSRCTLHVPRLEARPGIWRSAFHLQLRLCRLLGPFLLPFRPKSKTDPLRPVLALV